jgi:hypothetical protein
MTTICYRDGIMAGDSRAYGFDKVPVGSKMKPTRLPDGSLLGVSSSVVGCSQIVKEWVLAGMDSKAAPHRKKEDIDFQAMLVRPDGTCILIDGNWLPSDPISEAYYAIGSGREFALAALFLGKTAAEAVEVACHLDVWTGGRVETVRHEE